MPLLSRRFRPPDSRGDSAHFLGVLCCRQFRITASRPPYRPSGLSARGPSPTCERAGGHWLAPLHRCCEVVAVRHPGPDLSPPAVQRQDDLAQKYRRLGVAPGPAQPGAQVSRAPRRPTPHARRSLLWRTCWGSRPRWSVRGVWVEFGGIVDPRGTRKIRPDRLRCARMRAGRVS